MNLLRHVLFFLLAVGVFSDFETDFRHCETCFKIQLYPTQTSELKCTIFSQDPIYIEKIASHLAVTFSLKYSNFCKRSFKIGATLLKVQSPANLCSPNMDAVNYSLDEIFYP
jgi:hypothetical protein